MKHKLIILLLSISSTCFSQQVVATSGSSSTRENLSIDWTIGEPLIYTLTSENLVLTQGMHQCNLTVTSIFKTKNTDMEISAYPIPTRNFLTLETNENNFKDLSYKLFNLEGRLLLDKKLLSNNTEIALTIYQPAVYLLHVYNQNALIQSFKIVKH